MESDQNPNELKLKEELEAKLPRIQQSFYMLYYEFYHDDWITVHKTNENIDHWHEFVKIIKQNEMLYNLIEPESKMFDKNLAKSLEKTNDISKMAEFPTETPARRGSPDKRNRLVRKAPKYDARASIAKEKVAKGEPEKKLRESVKRREDVTEEKKEERNKSVDSETNELEGKRQKVAEIKEQKSG